jgi:uncharacterized Ntn-hydrolase superfamily protein
MMTTWWYLVCSAAGLVAWLSGPQQALAFRSIAACDRETSECGVATVSNSMGTSFRNSFGDVGVAGFSPGWDDVRATKALMEGIAAGLDAQSGIAQAIPYHFSPENWQVEVAALSSSSPTGVTVGSYTGSEVGSDGSAKCHVLGGTYAVSANEETDAGICHLMAQAFESAEGLQLARRLHAALVAAVGGNSIYPEYTASVTVWNGQWFLYPVAAVSVFAYVSFGLNWRPTLEFQLEAWLANWQLPGDTRELVEFTRPIQRAVLEALHDLGYYDGHADGWSKRAESALLAWEVAQFGWEIPTAVVHGKRMIERPVPYVLLNGKGRDFLVPAP